MDIVVDTSANMAVIVNEPSKPALIRATHRANLLALASVHWEIANAFSAMLKRNRLNLDEVLQALTLYKQIPIRFVEVELEESLHLASELDIYAYDAYLIRCAQKYQAPLLSLDQSLLRIAMKKNVQIIEVKL